MGTLIREEWKGTKKQRDLLREKYQGRCGYCGNILDKMHADHMEPVIRITTDPWSNPLPYSEQRMLKPENNFVDNMMPACPPCNIHKKGYKLEDWRKYLQRSGEIVRKQTSTFRAGERFGIITVHETPIEFYFEKVENGKI